MSPLILGLIGLAVFIVALLLNFWNGATLLKQIAVSVEEASFEELEKQHPLVYLLKKHGWRYVAQLVCVLATYAGALVIAAAFIWQVLLWAAAYV